MATAALLDPLAPIFTGCNGFATVDKWIGIEVCGVGGLTGGWNLLGTYWPMKEPSSVNCPRKKNELKVSID